MVLYTIGLPAFFSWILYTNRDAIRRDQTRRENRNLCGHHGDDTAGATGNQDGRVIVQYQELYWYYCLFSSLRVLIASSTRS